MAIFRPGVAMGAISGTVGGVNFANPRGSAVARKIALPKRRSTLASSTPQANLQRIIIAWRALTAEQRDAWRSWANTRTHPNRLGINRSISGYQEYLKYHLLRFNATKTTIDNPPVESDPQFLFDFNLNSDVSSGINVSFQDTTPFASRGGFLYGRPLFTKTIPKFNNTWTFLEFDNTITAQFDITASWRAQFGDPIEDQVIAVRLMPARFNTFIPEGIIDMFAITTP